MPATITLNSPLPDEQLLFQGITARQSLSAIDEIELELLSEKADIAPEDLLGKPIGVAMPTREGDTRHFHGIVTRLGIGQPVNRYYAYRASVRSWLWFLTRTSDCRIFQDLSVPEIVEQVFADHAAIAKFEFRLGSSYRPRTYCVQYRETDFNFVARLLEDEGIFWFFEHGEDEHKLILVDDVSALSATTGHERLPFYGHAGKAPPDLSYVSDWNFSREVQTGTFATTSFNFEHPSANLVVDAALVREHDLADYEFFDYQGDYTNKGDGQRLVDTRIDELQARHERLSGSTNSQGLAVGWLFDLYRHPRDDQNTSYLCAQSAITASVQGHESGNLHSDFHCSFGAVPAAFGFRPPRHTPRPVVNGPQTAMVVGPAGEEIFTDKYGRVKVQFHWDRYGQRDEKSSCWIRVSQPWAGKGWGGVSIPRIGQEVVVEFLEGDPDQPLITGRVYNGEAMPPYGLPEAAVVSGLKSQTHKGSGYNEMSMNDTAGKEMVTIHAQYDMGTTVQHDQTNTVNNDQTSTIKNDKTNTVNNKFTETIKSDTSITITEGKFSHDVAANTATYHVQGALTETYDATQTTTVKDKLTITSTAGPIAVSSSAQNIDITAATTIQIKVGASLIKMSSDGTIEISGTNISIKGSANVTIKGGTVHSEADSEHQTKGAIVLSDGSATNTVKGGMVMLNP